MPAEVSRPRVGIVGAGPAGLTAAYRLQQLGAEVTVFEAGRHVGGLARSFDLWGHRVDLGPHRFFSKDPRVNALWREVLGTDYRMVARQTRIYYRNRFFDYPLRIANVLSNLSFGDIAVCLASYLKQQLVPPTSAGGYDTFEGWVVRQFGRRLYEMFFKTYSEKLWGLPCSEIDADFAAQRIRGFSLGQSVLVALGLGKGRHKTLVDEFAYPRAGAGQLYENMARAVETGGGKVHLSNPVARVVTDGGVATGIELRDGSVHAFDHVISTMPLPLLMQGLDPPPDVADRVSRLRFRNTILVYLKDETTELFPDQWIYVPDDVLLGRVTNFRNWVPDLYGDLRSTVLAIEFWCNDDDAIWSETDQALIRRAESEVRTIGLLGSAAVSAGHVEKVRRSYPIYARGYRTTLAPVIAYLKTLKNLWPIGRYGAFKYNNQDHSILMGLLVAENICCGGAHDLWRINSDDDSYQEEAPSLIEPPSYSGSESRSLNLQDVGSE